jgi:hypothetical protein
MADKTMAALSAFARWLGRYVTQTVEDIHAGLIAGFDKLWYG